MGALTILTIVDDATHAMAHTAVAGVLPAAEVRRVDPAHVRQLPPGAVLIVADAANARLARATGFEGGIVIMRAAASPDELEAFRAQGTAFVDPASSPTEIVGALTASIPAERVERCAPPWSMLGA